MSHPHPETPAVQRVFTDPIAQLAALCPLCALAALDPVAALAALSPVLRIFNPAINPYAALLALTNPQIRVKQRIQRRLQQLRTRQILMKAGRTQG